MPYEKHSKSRIILGFIAVASASSAVMANPDLSDEFFYGDWSVEGAATKSGLEDCSIRYSFEEGDYTIHAACDDHGERSLEWGLWSFSEYHRQDSLVLTFRDVKGDNTLFLPELPIGYLILYEWNDDTFSVCISELPAEPCEDPSLTFQRATG